MLELFWGWTTKTGYIGICPLLYSHAYNKFCPPDRRSTFCPQVLRPYKRFILEKQSLSQKSDKNGSLWRNIVGVMLSGLPVAIWAVRWTGGSAWENRRGERRLERDREFAGRRGEWEKTDCVEDGRSIGQSPVCWTVPRRTDLIETRSSNVGTDYFTK